MPAPEKPHTNHFAFTQAKIRGLHLKEGSKQDEYWDATILSVA